jgi:DNA-binding MarR family transcriptional regulator
MAERRSLTQRNADDLLKSLLVASRTVQHVLEMRAIEVTGQPLTHSKIQILRLLSQRREQSPSHLATFLGVSKPAVTQIVTSMVGSGLLRRIDRPQDRRGFALKLTPKGKRVVQEIRTEQRHLVRSAFRVSSRRSADAWMDALNEVSASLAEAGRAFTQFCYQCGAHEDGSCVLVGGKAQCLYQNRQKKSQPRSRSRTTPRTARSKR